MKFVLAVALALIASTAPVLAAETVFQAVRVDGTVMPVTEDDLKAVPQITITVSINGLPQDEGRGSNIHQATGPRFRDFLNHFSIEGSVIDAVALDAYQIDIPVSDLMKYDVILATHLDGKKLSVRDRGPVWVIYPTGDHPELSTPVYESRSIWQISELKLR